MDPSLYPVSAATVEVLRRPLFGHVIDGEHVASVIPVIDPASDQEIAIAAAGSQADVDLAVRSARAAFGDEMTQIKSV
jgi:acyl-CoA reductase-like NAD-dependent aldehyde dehydrogenase